MKKRIIGALIALCTMLSIGALVAPSANAAITCSWASICGRVRISTQSTSSCYMSIDGNYGDGWAGTKKTLRDRDGYRYSGRFFKDTDAVRVKTGCNAYTYSSRTGVYIKKWTGGKVYKISVLTKTTVVLM